MKFRTTTMFQTTVAALFTASLLSTSAIASDGYSPTAFEFEAIDYISMGHKEYCSYDSRIVDGHNDVFSYLQDTYHAIEIDDAPNGRDTCFAMVKSVCKQIGFTGSPLLLRFLPHGRAKQSDDGQKYILGLVTRFICR